MQPQEIERLIKTGLPDCQAYVEGDGTHFNALVICAAFRDKTRIEKQQMVYATVKKELTDGTLHALSIKTMTPEECQAIDNANEGDQG